MVDGVFEPQKLWKLAESLCANTVAKRITHNNTKHNYYDPYAR